MRTVVIAFGLVCLMGAILAQSVGIGTSTPDPSARLDVSDNQRGILIPRLTTEERDGITNPARSLLIYNTDCDEYQYYIPGTGWVSILTNVTAGGSGSGTLSGLRLQHRGRYGDLPSWECLWARIGEYAL